MSNPESAEFRPLFKRSSTGAVIEWRIAVFANPDGTATIRTTYGQVGGKMQTKDDVVKVGLYIGKKNATTPLTQAWSEAGAKWKRQKDRQHYGEDPSGAESAAKRSLAPMLAESYWDDEGNLTTHGRAVDWTKAFAQPKLDGHRCLAVYEPGSGVRLVSRKGETLAVPHVRAAVAALLSRGWNPADPITLDGELYCHGVHVTTIGGWIKKAQPDSERLAYCVYDLVSPRPFSKRSTILKLLMFDEPSPLVRVVTRRVASHDDLVAYQKVSRGDGYEGAMLRWGDAPYEPGKRSKHLLKVKSFLDDEFMITAVKEGRGTFAGMAIFTCVTADGAPFDVTAPGSHAEKRLQLKFTKDYIGRKLKVKFAHWTRPRTATDKPRPFHPVALGLVDAISL